MWWAFLGSLAIGTSLGLLGSGGSIVTLPILLIVLHRPEKLAIAESLAIVGTIAVSAAIPYAMRQEVHWKSVGLYGLSGMVGSLVGAQSSHYVSGNVQVGLFGVVMLLAACMMLLTPQVVLTTEGKSRPSWMIGRDGFAIGCLTGFLGIGGGFLIVPALVLLGGLSMRLAVGTSLMIIALNAFTGFIGQVYQVTPEHFQVSWETIALVTLVGILGSWIGGALNKRISQERLRHLFAIFIALLGIYLLHSSTIMGV